MIQPGVILLLTLLAGEPATASAPAQVALAAVEVVDDARPASDDLGVYSTAAGEIPLVPHPLDDVPRILVWGDDNYLTGEICTFDDDLLPPAGLAIPEPAPLTEPGDPAGKLLGLWHLPDKGEPLARPINWAVDFVDISLGPIQQANLLLPPKLDPFGGEAAVLQDIRLRHRETDEGESSFTLAKQKSILGSTLAVRVDTPDDKAKWKLRIDAGGSFRQGTTESTNLRASTELRRESRNGTILMKAGTVLNDRATQEEIDFQANGELQLDRNLRGSWLFYALETLEHDQPRQVDLRSLTSAGLGFVFVNRLTQRWVLRTGPTGSYVRYSEESNSEVETLSGWLLESEYRRAFYESVRFEWTMRAFPDFSQEGRVRVRNEAAVLFPIGGKKSPWQWKVGLKHNYEQTAAQSKARTNPQDVEGYFSITYSR